MDTIFFGNGDDDWMPSQDEENGPDEFHGGGGKHTLGRPLTGGTTGSTATGATTTSTAG